PQHVGSSGDSTGSPSLSSSATVARPASGNSPSTRHVVNRPTRIAQPCVTVGGRGSLRTLARAVSIIIAARGRALPCAGEEIVQPRVLAAVPVVDGVVVVDRQGPGAGPGVSRAAARSRALGASRMNFEIHSSGASTRYTSHRRGDR